MVFLLCFLLPGLFVLSITSSIPAPFFSDVKPTAETLVPTLKSEETTTPYPTDEEATECGDSCGEEEGMYQSSIFVSIRDGLRAKKLLLSSH